MRVALVQADAVVGDVSGNAVRLADAYAEAVAGGAELVVTTELALCGYPPEDLLWRTGFVEAVESALADLAADVGAVPFVVGVVEHLGAAEREGWHPVASEAGGQPLLANAAAVLRDGAVAQTYRKHRLPNYGVFDEARYFVAGSQPCTFDVGGTTVGVTICEDLWGAGGPVSAAGEAGASIILNLNASPYAQGKRAEREHWAAVHASATGAWLVYVNQVGGQDEVVFDGDSFVMAPDGTVTARLAQFRADAAIVEVGGAMAGAADAEPRLDPLGEVYAALVRGTADYVRKNGFSSVLVGLSGGIDSALVAAVAADALGPDAVTALAMPSPYSSPGSLTDAEDLAGRLGIRYEILPISTAMKAFDEALDEHFAGTESGVAEENIQSRIRGTLLMAMSNKFGHMVLATGNKSEYAVGYATLYGDMAGGFAVIKDVPKTLVFALCEWRNTASADWLAAPDGEVIPRAIIDKPPSAELRPDQFDTDSLPDYDVLDPILEAYVEQDADVATIVAQGFDEATVRRVVRLVDVAEYKRRQAAPGVKVTTRAFGRDRRVPITNAWRGGA
jgi:NAD+ synthase (glutamine-hydrolysing)